MKNCEKRNKERNDLWNVVMSRVRDTRCAWFFETNRIVRSIHTPHPFQEYGTGIFEHSLLSFSFVWLRNRLFFSFTKQISIFFHINTIISWFRSDSFKLFSIKYFPLPSPLLPHSHSYISDSFLFSLEIFSWTKKNKRVTNFFALCWWLIHWCEVRWMWNYYYYYWHYYSLIEIIDLFFVFLCWSAEWYE